MFKRLLLVSITIIFLVLPASAHSGRTDSRGGHYNHETGEYHYHHGYPEHQHIDGVCPYESSVITCAEEDSSSALSPSTQLREAIYPDYDPDPGSPEAYDSGFIDGRNSGYEYGYDSGYSTGYSEGYSSGYTEGRKNVISIAKTGACAALLLVVFFVARKLWRKNHV